MPLYTYKVKQQLKILGVCARVRFPGVALACVTCCVQPGNHNHPSSVGRFTPYRFRTNTSTARPEEQGDPARREENPSNRKRCIVGYWFHEKWTVPRARSIRKAPPQFVLSSSERDKPGSPGRHSRGKRSPIILKRSPSAPTAETCARTASTKGGDRALGGRPAARSLARPLAPPGSSAAAPPPLRNTVNARQKQERRAYYE